MNNYIYGIHSVKSCILQNPKLITQIYLDDERNDARFSELLQMAKAHNIAVKNVDRAKLASYGITTTQKLVALVKPWQSDMTLNELLPNLSSTATVLILDGVTDLHNLGAIIRTSECLGVAAIILPKNNAANPAHPTVCHTSSGALYHLPIVIVNNIVTAIDKLKEHGFWVCGSALCDTAVSLYEFKPPEKVAWVMGSEDKGIRRLVLENCDYVVKIPLCGVTQSLNVSVAAGILLSHTCKV